jgi:hypothetical protein
MADCTSSIYLLNEQFLWVFLPTSPKTFRIVEIITAI